MTWKPKVRRKVGTSTNIPKKYLGMFPPIGSYCKYQEKQTDEPNYYVILNYVNSYRSYRPALKAKVLENIEGHQEIRYHWIHYYFIENGWLTVLSQSEDTIVSAG